MRDENDLILQDLESRLVIPEAKNDLDNFNEENARIYGTVKEEKEKLDALYKVMKPFENKLKEKTGYGKNNAPSKKDVITVDVGTVSFEIECTKDSDVKYKKVIDNITQYIKDIVDRRDRQFISPGVIRSNGKTYVLIDDLQGKIKNELQENKEISTSFKIKYKK